MSPATLAVHGVYIVLISLGDTGVVNIVAAAAKCDLAVYDVDSRNVDGDVVPSMARP